jgi:hemin uptake protein HemP
MTESTISPPESAELPAEPRRIESDVLFQGARVVMITHAGEAYRLMVTKNNRLILQK